MTLRPLNAPIAQPQTLYVRGGQPMAHAPNVAHCMIRGGALHL